MDSNINIRRLMEVLTDKSVDFLDKELKLSTISKEIFLKDIPRISLDYLTSLITMDGHISALFAFSYEEELINMIFDRYTMDIDVEPDEKDIYLEESAGEIINIIIGNATGEFEIKDSILTFSTPIVLTEAKNLIKKKEAKFYNSTINTEHGKMNIYCIIPKDAV